MRGSSPRMTTRWIKSTGIRCSSKLLRLLFGAYPTFVAFALGAVSNEAVASDLTRHVGAGPNIGLILVWGLVCQEVGLGRAVSWPSTGRRRSTVSSQAATTCGRAAGWYGV